MHRAIAVAVLGVFLAGDARLAAQTSDRAMAVFMTAAAVTDVIKVDKETQKRLELAIKDAQKNRKELEKTLKAQHGNKRDKWPEEAENRYLDAEEAVALADTNFLYRKVNQAGLTDSVEDLRQALTGHGLAGKKENVRLVDAATDAQLIIEVVGRRSASGGQAGGLLALRDDQYWLLLAVKPGPKLTAERFDAVLLTSQYARFNKRFSQIGPRPEAPEWRFEAYGDLRWANAAHAASLIIEGFIAKNYDLMMKASTRN